MSPLYRAVAIAEVHDVPMLIGQHLHFDVPRAIDVALQIDFAAAEGYVGFSGGGLQGGREILGVAYDPHAPATATEGRFDNQGVADSRRLLNGGGSWK